MAPKEQPINTAGKIALLQKEDEFLDRRLEGVEKNIEGLRGEVCGLRDCVTEQTKELTRLAVSVDAALARRQAEDKPEPWFTSAQKKTIAWSLVVILSALAAILGASGEADTTDPPDSKPATVQVEAAE